MKPARPGEQRIRIERLEEYCVSAMLACGMRREDARLTARVLVTTDSWGTFTHGTKHLRLYLARIRAGGVDPVAVPEVVAEGPGWAMIDARRAMGMVSSCRAMELAVEKARSCGIAYVGVKQSTHFGAAGFYAYLAAEKGMIGIAMSNVDANMSVPGARGGVIGNNPFSYAVPVADGHPILLDVALSTVAAGKVGAAKDRGEPIPDTWLVDEHGVPTTDASAYPQRASLLPVGGHKGYGLAVMVEVLAAVLTGASITRAVKSWILEPDKVTDEGHAFIAIDAGAMMPRELFEARVDGLAKAIRESPKAKGCSRIYLPGEKEWENREEALKSGIRLPPDVVASLERLGEECGIGRPPYLGNDA
jgi:ureidoglycolate dehydrogenase (NAD+)